MTTDQMNSSGATWPTGVPFPTASGAPMPLVVYPAGAATIVPAAPATEYEAALTGEQFVARIALDQWEFADSGSPGTAFSVRGYSAVFGVLSSDMGGFRTRLDAGLLDEVLASNPDVHFNWDHDMRYVMARTKNDTLKLSADDHGLYMEAKVGQYSWAKDLRVAMERGDIDQGSIAIAIAEDQWSVFGEDENAVVIRDVTKASQLFDTTVTAKGAFPQTSLEAAYSLMRSAVAEGHLPESVGAKLVTPGTIPAGEEPSRVSGGSEGEPNATDEWAEDLRHKFAARRHEFAALLERSKAL